MSDQVQAFIAQKNFPKAIDASPQGLTLHLWPRQSADAHELQGGAVMTNGPKLKTLVESYQTPEVKEFVLAKFKGAVLPSW